MNETKVTWRAVVRNQRRWASRLSKVLRKKLLPMPSVIVSSKKSTGGAFYAKRDAKAPVRPTIAPAGHAVYFRSNATRNYADVQKQIVDYLSTHLHEAGFDVVDSPSNERNVCSIAMFIRDAGRVYIGHNLADKNYLLQRDETGGAAINRFEHVFVPGNWHRRRLLKSPHCHLRPDQIHLLGAPRVDYLRECQAALAQSLIVSDALRPLNVLWAPVHDRWTNEDTILSSYPAFETYLDLPELAERADIVWKTVPHPRNRKDKKAITDDLINADIVISDYSSVLYEAWALGKPVIFPRWLLGDHVLDKAPGSAEAHIYRERIGYHPDSFADFLALLRADLPLTQDVHDFMRDYLHNFEKPGCGKQVAHLLNWILAPDRNLEQLALKIEDSMSEGTWEEAREILRQHELAYNEKLPLPDVKLNDYYVATLLWAQVATAQEAKQWPQAEEHLRELIGYAPESAKVYNQLAHMLRKQGKWWQEIEALKSAIALDGRDARWFYRLGEALEVMKRYRQAAQAYQQAIERDGDQAEWYYRLGYALEREGHDGPANPERTPRAYAQAIALDKKLDARRFGIGVFHQQRGHWPQARDAYRQHLQSINASDAAVLLYRLGVAHDRCYEWAEAAFHYRAALTLRPDMPAWHHRLGFVLERQGQLAEAAMAYRHAALNAPKHTPAWFYRWGYVLHRLGRYTEAVQAYLMMQLGSDITAHGEKAAALPSLRSPAEIENEQAGLILAIASSAEYSKLFDSRDTISVLLSYLEQNTTNPHHWYMLATAYEGIGDWPQAADAYEQAVLRQNDHTPGWYFRWGYALAQCGEVEKACIAFDQTERYMRAHGVNTTNYDKNPGLTEVLEYTELLETLPVEHDIIMYESYFGANISCNPYAIYNYLQKAPEYANYKHVWVVAKNTVIPTVLRSKKNTIFVKRGSYLYKKFLAKAGYLINNVTFPSYFIRREEQKYLNTWHGTPLKALGKNMVAREKVVDHKNVTRNFLHTTHLISGNPHTTRVMIEDYEVEGIYPGKIAETGYPRQDAIFASTSAAKESICKRLGLSPEEPVILFAPTWRGVFGAENTDFEQLTANIEALASSGYQIVLRGHHLMEEALREVSVSVIIVPDDISTYDLLPCVDALITDYSSILFDYIPLERPIFYFAYDYEDFIQERGQLYFDYSELPGYMCADIDELVLTIRRVMRAEYVPDDLHRTAITKFCPHDDGEASARTVKFFFADDEDGVNVSPTRSDDRTSILLFGGMFMPNGITSSFNNLMNSMDSNHIRAVVAVAPEAIAAHPDRLAQFDKIPKHVQKIGRVGRMLYTVEEKWIVDKFNQHRSLINVHQKHIYENAFKREFRRTFGHSKWQAAIHFEGYNNFWASIFANAHDQTGSSAIYLHNDMNLEWKKKFPYLEGMFDIYRGFDTLVSVSETMSEVNKSSLIEVNELPTDRFVACHNVINAESIFELSMLPVDQEIGAWLGSNRLFITLGRFSPEKDHRKLLDAFAQVKMQAPEVKLLILGDGPLRRDLEQHVCRLNLEDSVLMPGNLQNPFPYVNRADCFVLSSNHEGQPMVLLEAMALGKPIVATDIDGNRGVLSDQYGLLVHNSVDALAEGMLAFLNGDVPPTSCDYRAYQAHALDMFYEQVCNTNPANLTIREGSISQSSMPSGEGSW